MLEERNGQDRGTRAGDGSSGRFYGGAAGDPGCVCAVRVRGVPDKNRLAASGLVQRRRRYGAGLRKLRLLERTNLQASRKKKGGGETMGTMKEIRTWFEQCPELEQIEVVIRAAARDADVDRLLRQLSESTAEPLTVTAATGELMRVSANDIVSAAVFNKLTLIVTENGRYTVRQSLQSLEKDLEGGRFVRVSRHELVNLDKVRKFDFTLDGTLRLELVGGMETWASRRNIPLIRKMLTDRRTRK